MDFTFNTGRQYSNLGQLIRVVLHSRASTPYANFALINFEDQTRGIRGQIRLPFSDPQELTEDAVRVAVMSHYDCGNYFSCLGLEDDGQLFIRILVAEVRDYARLHLGHGGWAYIDEFVGDADLAEMVADANTPVAAVQSVFERAELEKTDKRLKEHKGMFKRLATNPN